MFDWKIQRKQKFVILHYTLCQYINVFIGLKNALNRLQCITDLVPCSANMQFVYLFVKSIVIISQIPSRNKEDTIFVLSLLEEVDMPRALKKCGFYTKSLDYPE